MILLILIILFFSVLEDARILRREDEVLYAQIFRFSEKTWAWLCVLFLIGALPVYLLRRRRFKAHFMIDGNAPSSSRLFSDALGVMLVWILVMALWAVGVTLLSPFYPSFGKGIGELVFSVALMHVFILVLIYQTIRNYPGENFFSFLALTKSKASRWKTIAIPVIAGLIFAFLSASVITGRDVQPITPLSEVLEATTSSMLMLIFLAMAVVVAPLVEEIIFRGYFFRVLAQVRGGVPAVIIVSLVFAFLHVGQYWGDWAAIGMVALLGFVLTSLRAWTGSTVSSAVAHYVYNGTLTILPILALVLVNPVYMEYETRYAQLNVQQRETLLKQSIAQYPKFDAAYNDLAWIYAQENKSLEKALELADTALKLNPHNEAYMDTKAEVLFRLGRVHEAIVLEEELAKRDPSVEYFKKQLERFKAKNLDSDF